MSEVEISVVAGLFQARSGKEAELAATLARYVVLTRSVTGVRNVDLVIAAATPGRFLIVEKWDDADAQRAHLDSDLMVTMATQAAPLLTQPPDLELYDVISAHDLV
ncbi:MAG: antibiotic biosynthesis monooxygenase [Acidimicrobiia bacterium]